MIIIAFKGKSEKYNNENRIIGENEEQSGIKESLERKGN